MPAKYPSWEKDYRHAWMKNRMKDPSKSEKILAQKKSYYFRHRNKIRARLRARYHSDPEYREKAKLLARKSSAKNPEKARNKKLCYYNKHRAELVKKSRDYYHSHRSEMMVKGAAYRERYRSRNRLVARAHSQLITDRYVREQLSKYHTKSMWEWTTQEVAAKREVIILGRIKRITIEKASQIRTLYHEGVDESINTIARKFAVSPSLIHMIIKNECHFDPDYKFVPRTDWVKSASNLLRMINSSESISEFLNQNARD